MARLTVPGVPDHTMEELNVSVVSVAGRPTLVLSSPETGDARFRVRFSDVDCLRIALDLVRCLEEKVGVFPW